MFVMLGFFGGVGFDLCGCDCFFVFCGLGLVGLCFDFFFLGGVGWVYFGFSGGYF